MNDSQYLTLLRKALAFELWDEPPVRPIESNGAYEQGHMACAIVMAIPDNLHVAAEKKAMKCGR